MHLFLRVPARKVVDGVENAVFSISKIKMGRKIKRKRDRMSTGRSMMCVHHRSTGRSGVERLVKGIRDRDLNEKAVTTMMSVCFR